MHRTGRPMSRIFFLNWEKYHLKYWDQHKISGNNALAERSPMEPGVPYFIGEVNTDGLLQCSHPCLGGCSCPIIDAVVGGNVPSGATPFGNIV